MKNYQDVHIQRWDEIPDFPLYIDQVVSIVEKSLDFLPKNEKDKLITNTMINNYVKFGIVEPPVKKKYTRVHVAYFTVVCLLKRVYSLDEISKLIQLQVVDFPIDHAYDTFCQKFELYLSDPNKDDIIKDPKSRQEELLNLFYYVIRSIVYKIVVQDEILAAKELQEFDKKKK